MLTSLDLPPQTLPEELSLTAPLNKNISILILSKLMTVCLIPESIDCFVLMKSLFVPVLIFAYLMYIFIFEVAICLFILNT